MVLWILICHSPFCLRDFYPLWCQLSFWSSARLCGSLYQSATPHRLRDTVWPLPLSLATTYGISVDFFSCRYLDVSVPRVYLLHTMYSCTDTWAFTSGGFPHSDIHESMAICASSWLFAACHVLLRLLVPRHSPYALYSLTLFFTNKLMNVEFYCRLCFLHDFTAHTLCLPLPLFKAIQKAKQLSQYIQQLSFWNEWFWQS